MSVVCACAPNSVGRHHRVGKTPCQMTTADTEARFLVVGVHREQAYRNRRWEATGNIYAVVWRSYNTVKGARKWAPDAEPVEWENLDWSGQRFYQIVRNPLFDG